MTNIRKVLTTFSVFTGILLAGSSIMAVDLSRVGPIEDPHGYPAWFADSNGLKLELCTNSPLCLFDPVEVGNAFSEANGFGAEAFWLLAGSSTTVNGGNALLTLALEAAFGGDATVTNGNQVSFGRVRVRIDNVFEGETYRVTHPYGEVIFPNLQPDLTGTVEINATKDIGGVNILNPADAFPATLLSDVMNPGTSLTVPAPTSFITWPDYATNADLLDGQGRRYIGNPGTLSPVVGSPAGNNFFRIERYTAGVYVPGSPAAENPANWETLAEEINFSLQGRVFDERVVTPFAGYGTPPTQNLTALGPINRATPFTAGSTAKITGAVVPKYPIGYPLWYQDGNGLKLTITFPPMGISQEVIPPENFPLNTAGETFYWSAGANFDGLVGPDAAEADAVSPLVELAMEGTFAGGEAIVDGFQIAFGRLRIWLDTITVPGTYTVFHPYGENVFVVTADDITEGGGEFRSRFTMDVGNVNPYNPDAAFSGALHSTIGPNFLTWDTFSPIPALNDPLLQKVNPDNPTGPLLQYVGDPATPHAVTGGSIRNSVRITGPGGIDFETTLFDITGQVFAGRNFGFIPAVNFLLLE